MSVRSDELKRIKARIVKADARIKAGYVSPKGDETEASRKARLTARLTELTQ